MKKLLFIIIVFTSLIVKAGNYEVTIWGTNECQYTTGLMNDLRKAGISFTYYNVLGEKKNLDAMFEFANYWHLVVYPQVQLPVVRVVEGGIVYALIRPSVHTILKLTPVIDVKAEEFTIYPNPVRDVLHVSGAGMVEIYDLSGHGVISSDEKQIIVNSLQAGTYLAKYRGYTLKFVKK